MKKITKTMIKNAPRFMAVIDWKTEKRETGEPFSYMLLTAKTIPEAMTEAERFIDDTVYLVKLLENTETLDAPYNTDETMGIIYNAILCNRKNGWHENDHSHSEGRFQAAYNPLWSYDPITFYKGSFGD